MTKIYAIRDRMLDYFNTPFAGPDDKTVLAGIAHMINNGDSKDAIAQAPSHFEVWELAIVTEDGHIDPVRSLICDCASLVRSGGRLKPGEDTHRNAFNGKQSPPEPTSAGTGT